MTTPVKIAAITSSLFLASALLAYEGDYIHFGTRSPVQPPVKINGAEGGSVLLPSTKDQIKDSPPSVILPSSKSDILASPPASNPDVILFSSKSAGISAPPPTPKPPEILPGSKSLIIGSPLPATTAPTK